MATNTKPGKPSTTLDFTKVFSENSPIQPFTWTLSEYLKGWSAIEMTPPARQQFDALQAHSDRKENWLYNQYLEGYVDKFLDYLDTVKAPINSPTFSGDPKAPTPSKSDNDTSLATTAFVREWVHDLQEQIDAIEGGGGGGEGGGKGIGVTRTGAWYVCWGDVLYMQWANCMTDSNGIGTVNWPISFRSHPNGSGVYHPIGNIANATLGEMPIFSFNDGPEYATPDRCTFQVRYPDGTPCAGKTAAVLAWGQKDAPDTWDLED